MTDTHHPIAVLTDSLLESLDDVARAVCRNAELSRAEMSRKELIRKLLRLFPRRDREVWRRLIERVADRALESLYHPHSRRPRRVAADSSVPECPTRV